MTEVILHVYDLTKSGKGNDTMNFMVVQMNKLLKDGINLGGIFHVAVQIHDEVEWAYGHREKGSGIFSCPATKNPHYTFRESIPAGRTHCSSSKVNLILKELRDEWPGNEYSLVSRNSKHFCEEFLERIGVPKLPAWANRLANVGDAAKDVGNKMKQAKNDMFNKFFKSPTNNPDSQPSVKPSKSKSKSQIENLPIIGFGMKSIAKNFRVNAPVIALDDKPAVNEEAEEEEDDKKNTSELKGFEDSDDEKIKRLPEAPAACIRIEYVDSDECIKEGKEPIVEEPISDEEYSDDSEDDETTTKMKKKSNQQKLKGMKLISAA